MKNELALDQLYEALMDAIEDIENNQEFAEYFYNYSRSGKNVYYRKTLTETKLFDEKWIETLEAFFPSIDRILKNPPSSIKLESEIVAVERARKINAQTITHLASHTANIREVLPDGTVKPSRLLTHYAEKDDATYENRFVKTLIKKTKIFIQNRYVVIRDNVESFEKDHLNYTTDFMIHDQQLNLNLDFTVKKDLDNTSINEHNKVLLHRVEKLKRLIDGYDCSPFMQTLKNTKDVHSPIMKTNLILKNPDFRNCYALWLFLDKYTSLGYDANIKEKEIPLNNDMDKVLQRINMFIYASTFFNRENRVVINYDEYEEKTKKSTKVAKTHIDDVVDRPDEIILSDDVINEAYLQQYRKMFNEKVADYDKEFATHDSSVKKAIRDLLSITEAVLDSAFNIVDDEDYFTQLTKVKDYKKESEAIKEKIKYAKFIREAKEVDYKNAIKAEKNLQKELDACYKLMISNNNEKLRDETFKDLNKRIEKDNLALKKMREKVKNEILNLQGKTEDALALKLKQKEDKTLFDQNIKDQIKDLKANYKQKLKNDIKKLELKHRLKMEKEQAKLNLILQKEKEKQELKKQKMIEEGKLKIAKAKEALKSKYQKDLQSYKQSLNIDVKTSIKDGEASE